MKLYLDLYMWNIKMLIQYSTGFVCFQCVSCLSECIKTHRQFTHQECSKSPDIIWMECNMCFCKMLDIYYVYHVYPCIYNMCIFSACISLSQVAVGQTDRVRFVLEPPQMLKGDFMVRCLSVSYTHTHTHTHTQTASYKTAHCIIYISSFSADCVLS